MRDCMDFNYSCMGIQDHEKIFKKLKLTTQNYMYLKQRVHAYYLVVVVQAALKDQEGSDVGAYRDWRGSTRRIG